MKKVLGIPILLLAGILLVVGGASAALVSYLSNTTTATATVNSPLTMSGGVLVNAEIYGGDNIEYTVTTVNNADAEVWSFAVTEVTAPTGTTFTGEEFTKIVLKDNNYPSGVEITSMMKYVRPDGTLASFSLIGQDSLNEAKIVFDNGVTFDATKGYVRGVGFNEWNTVIITTNPAIFPGEYVIESCQLYTLEGNC